MSGSGDVLTAAGAKAYQVDTVPDRLVGVPRAGFMEPSEFQIVATALPSYLVDPACFAYIAGCRKGEVSSLEWCDVTLERRDGDIVGGVIRLRSVPRRPAGRVCWS